ncbi:MAG: inorganic pyrophosphatase Ppa [Candidatus Thorarchaeota archaeon]|jgi:inorganic pyrophosphatase
MPDSNLPSETAKFEVQAYEEPSDLSHFRKTHVPYTGSPHKHPYDSRKVILVPDPYGNKRTYFEFKIDDISYVEELPNLVDLAGKVISMARIWVEKGSVALLCSVFVVEETTR